MINVYILIAALWFNLISLEKNDMEAPWHLYLMGIMYIVAGSIHFIKPRMYERIMPRYLPAHRTMVYLSGAAEIILGIGLFFEQSRPFAICGIIAMLIIFLLVHFYMLSSKKAGAGIPQWALVLRIPLQFFLMYWAWYYLQF